MLNRLERRSLFECFADLRGTADHVKWILVVNVFIRRHLPAELARVHVMRKLRHRDAREPWLEHVAIEHVNLYTATTHTRMLLKCRLKYATAEIHARQFEI